MPMDLNSDFCNAVKSSIIQMEVNILHALGYEVQRLHETPHKFLLMFLKTLKAEKNLAQVAFNAANDSFLTTASIHYPPNLLATACIYLAFRITKSPFPKVAWWLLSEYSFDLVEAAARSIYRAYEQDTPSLARACQFAKIAGGKPSSLFGSSLSFSPMYKITDEGLGGEVHRKVETPPDRSPDLGRDISKDRQPKVKENSREDRPKRQSRSHSSSRNR